MTDQHPYIEPGTTERSEGGPPLVHPQETSTSFDLPSGYRSFLISGDLKRVNYYRELYSFLDLRDGKRRAANYDNCRSMAWFVRHKTTHEVRVASTRCNLRWCPLCMKTKRMIMTQTITPWIQKRQKPKFITFTLKHSDDPLSDQLERLYNCFKLLRNSKLWKSHITGGMWFFQVTKSERTGQWHPHLHVIAVGKYLPHMDLRVKWYKITKDSNIVDIRAIKDARKTADYVARYATAPADLVKLPLDDAVEVFDALSGRRMCGTFGTGKEIQLVPKKCPDADDWEDLGSFREICSNRFNDPTAAAVFFAWTTKTPCNVEVKPPPPNPDWYNIKEFEPESYKQATFQWLEFYN